jgi:hypothetical protein
MSNEVEVTENGPVKKAMKKAPEAPKDTGLEDRIKLFKELNKKASKLPVFDSWRQNEKGNWLFKFKATGHSIIVYKDKAGAWAIIYTFGPEDKSFDPAVFATEDEAKTASMDTYKKNILGEK